MSTLKTTLQVAGVVAFAAAAGTTYVLIHEHRRRSKKGRKAEGDCAVSGAGSSCNSLQPEQLVRLLTECAHSAYQLIEQTRKMVHEKHASTGQKLEDCVDELQRGFESAMETVMASIRAKHGVEEAAMSAAMQLHAGVPEVASAVTALRDAMAGKPPLGYGKASEAAAAEAAKQRVRRNKSKRKG